MEKRTVTGGKETYYRRKRDLTYRTRAAQPVTSGKANKKIKNRPTKKKFKIGILKHSAMANTYRWRYELNMNHP